MPPTRPFVSKFRVPARALPLLSLAWVTLLAAGARAEALFDAKSTYAVVAGVLEWSDPAFKPFPKEKRKDQELYDTLGALGVPAAQRALLLDGDATKDKVEAALAAAVAKAPAGSTLIFYFAGHGWKDPDGNIIFTTSDIRLNDAENTGWHLVRMAKALERFKGKRVLLLADCCYSGGLSLVASELARAKKDLQVLALTSSEATNTSTRNWTYTQALIDALRGRALVDGDKSGQITLGELVVEVKESMRFREGQRAGLEMQRLSDTLVVAPAAPADKQLEDGKGDFERRDWVRIPTGSGATAIARIVGADTSGRGQGRGVLLLVELYDYATRTETWVEKKQADPLTFKTWPVGTAIDVTWKGQVYAARVEKIDSGLMWITYPGFERKWDEWIDATRVVGVTQAAETRRHAQVEWRGRWYDAVVNGQKGNTTCISYVGYGADWDECVPPERIRLK